MSSQRGATTLRRNVGTKTECGWHGHVTPAVAVTIAVTQRPCGHDLHEVPTCSKHIEQLTSVGGGTAKNAIPCPQCSVVNRSKIIRTRPLTP
jgi:hypothetical protein